MNYFMTLIYVVICFAEISKCASEVLDKRVIGGKTDEENELKWAVSLIGDIPEYKLSGACGATIINTGGKINWLLTAAHCFFPSSTLKNTNPKNWHARIGLSKVNFDYGAHNLETKLKDKAKGFWSRFKNLLTKGKFVDSNSKTIHVEKVYIHPKYNASRLEYDIALMKLKRAIPVELMKNVETVELPNPQMSDRPRLGEVCLVKGWGCTTAGGKPSEVAKYVKLEIWDNKACEKDFVEDIDLNPKHEFCAGYSRNKIGLCPGDSGSGLVCIIDGAKYVTGVVSAAHSETPGQYPAIFTRVSYFRDWIDSTIKFN